MIPVSPSVLRHRLTYREAFRSDHPLPNFNVIPNFLRTELIRDIVPACQKGRYETFCGYVRPNLTETRSEFCEPNQTDTYVTIHERPVQAIKPLARLHAMFREAATLAALSDLTGLTLEYVGPHVLTSWQPGSFLESHTDYVAGGEAKLILSISLAKQWRDAYGGSTVYEWKDFVRGVRIPPRCNTAVLFVPFSGSNHWVEQVSPHAPARRRFTWTMFFS